MAITYDQYQLIKFLASNNQNAPAGFKFEAEGTNARNFLSASKSFQNLFSDIIARNSFAKFQQHQNYYIPNSLFQKIEFDSDFRNHNFTKFFNLNMASTSGSVLMDGGQYVYLLLNEHETKFAKAIEGKYYAAALFSNNLFLGFEEGLVKNASLDVFPTGYYSAGMDRGGYLSFTTIFLAYINQKTNNPLLIPEINKTKEKIFLIE